MKALWVAVLRQSIMDITEPKAKPMSTELRDYCRRSAIAWVRSKAMDLQSFLGICEILKIDPEQTRDRILSMPRAAI